MIKWRKNDYTFPPLTGIKITYFDNRCESTIHHPDTSKNNNEKKKRLHNAQVRV